MYSSPAKTNSLISSSLALPLNSVEASNLNIMAQGHLDKSTSGSNFNEATDLLPNYDENEGLLGDSVKVSVSLKEENVKIFRPTIPDTCSRRSMSGVTVGYTVDEAIDKLGFGPFQLMIFIFCGLIWLADAMELMILSILSPAVKCQWSLSSVEEAIITSIVFVGFLLGSMFWGFTGDNYGRKKTFLAMVLVILISAVCSALKLTPDDDRIPGYPWMLLCRFGVGFGASGIAQASIYYAEFLPRRTRAICTVCLSGWWGIGTMFGAALAVGVMGHDRLGWHWYLGLSATPMVIVLCFIPFVPESARLHVSKGKKKEAVKVLRRIAWFNFTSLPPGELLMSPRTKDEKERKEDSGKKEDIGSKSTDFASTTFEESFTADDRNVDGSNEREPLLTQENGINSSKKISLPHRLLFSVMNGISKLPLLFVNGMWRSTIPLCCLWFGSAWLYYGSVLLTTTMLQDNPHCDHEDSALSPASGSGYDGNTTNGSNATSCEDGELDTSDYLRIMWTSGAEMPGLLVTILIIEIIGRKLTMVVNLTMTMLGFCLLFICTGDTLLTFFFFIIRAFSVGIFQTMYAYTSEVYPTNIRGVGIGFASSVARLGAIVTPYVAQVLFHASDYATISLYAGSCLVLAVVALLLPIETKGKSLKD